MTWEKCPQKLVKNEKEDIDGGDSTAKENGTGASK